MKDHYIDGRAASLLATTYGSISIHDGEFEFHDQKVPPPKEVIEAARKKAIEEIGFVKRKQECMDQIYKLIRSEATKGNMNAWTLRLVSKQSSRQPLTKEEQSDLNIAHAITHWIHDMMAAAITPEPRWPKPPSGAAAFISRF